MKHEIIKQHLSEIETACSMARIALLTSDSSDKVWSQAAMIIGNAQAIQQETGNTILKPATS